MNPLNQFGIKTRVIRGDTTSYNSICPECGKKLTNKDCYGHDCEVPRKQQERKKNLKAWGKDWMWEE
jgi:hypothetical protein